jgi:hypothetical protein
VEGYAGCGGDLLIFGETVMTEEAKDINEERHVAMLDNGISFEKLKEEDLFEAVKKCDDLMRCWKERIEERLGGSEKLVGRWRLYERNGRVYYKFVDGSEDDHAVRSDTERDKMRFERIFRDASEYHPIPVGDVGKIKEIWRSLFLGQNQGKTKYDEEMWKKIESEKGMKSDEDFIEWANKLNGSFHAVVHDVKKEADHIVNDTTECSTGSSPTINEDDEFGVKMWVEMERGVNYLKRKKFLELTDPTANHGDCPDPIDGEPKEFRELLRESRWIRANSIFVFGTNLDDMDAEELKTRLIQVCAQRRIADKKWEKAKEVMDGNDEQTLGDWLLPFMESYGNAVENADEEKIFRAIHEKALKDD